MENILLSGADLNGFCFSRLVCANMQSAFWSLFRIDSPTHRLDGEEISERARCFNIAYTAALRAKVLDCLRGLLPSSTLTNMGMYGNGRFFEALIQKLNCHNLAEMQDIGKKAFQELAKVIPSFVRRSDPSHKHQKIYAQFREQMNDDLKMLSLRHTLRLQRCNMRECV